MTTLQQIKLVMNSEPLSTRTHEEQMIDWVRRTGKLLAENGTEKKWEYYLKVNNQIEKQTN